MLELKCNFIKNILKSSLVEIFGDCSEANTGKVMRKFTITLKNNKTCELKEIICEENAANKSELEVIQNLREMWADDENNSIVSINKIS